MRDQALQRIRAAREERERGPDVPRRVVERAAQASPPRSGCGTGRPRCRASRGSPPKTSTVPPGRTSSSARSTPRPCRPPRSRRRRPRPSAGHRAERRRELAPLLTRPTATGRPPASATQAQSISPIGPSADDGDGLAVLDPGRVDAVEAARERLDQRRDLGREAPAGRAGGSSRAIRSGTRRSSAYAPFSSGRRFSQSVSWPAAASGARAARRRVGRDDSASGRDVDPAELVPERARQLAEQHGVSAAVRLEVGAVGQRDLDLDRTSPRRESGQGRPRAGGRPGRGGSSALTG